MADFPITLTVRAVPPDEGFFLAVDPPAREVDQGVVATFAVVLSGEFAGGIDLSIQNAPEGAVPSFDQENPVFVGDTVTLTIETTNVAAGAHEMIVRATAAV